LSENDVKTFQKAQKEAEKAKYGKTIEEFITFKG
jgi:hypothetical protein